MKLFLVWLVVYSAVTLVAAPEPKVREQWVRKHTGYLVFDAIADNLGNIAVAGSSSAGSTVLLFNPHGKLINSVTHPDNTGVLIRANDNGDIALIGTPESYTARIWVSAYSALLQKQHFAVNGWSVPTLFSYHTILRDAVFNTQLRAFVLSSTSPYRSGEDRNGSISAIDSTGTPWIAEYWPVGLGGNVYALPVGVRFAKNGDVIAAIDQLHGHFPEFFSRFTLARHTPNGDVVWLNDFATDEFWRSWERALALDSSDNIVIATQDGVVKFDSAGNRLWGAANPLVANVTSYNPDRQVSVAITSDDSIVVTGPLGTSKFSATGSLVWHAPIAASAIALDADGNVLLSGTAATDRDDTDVITLKLNSSGQTAWTATFNGETNTYDQFLALIPQKQDGIYVAAKAFRPGGAPPDLVLIKYVERGAPVR
jgi:hypothetical protein